MEGTIPPTVTPLPLPSTLTLPITSTMQVHGQTIYTGVQRKVF